MRVFHQAQTKLTSTILRGLKALWCDDESRQKLRQYLEKNIVPKVRKEIGRPRCVRNRLWWRRMFGIRRMPACIGMRYA